MEKDLQLMHIQRWVFAIHDMDAILEKFFSQCHDDGYRCKLYRQGDTVDNVRQRFQSVMQKVRLTPLTIIAPLSRIPVIVTESDLRVVLFRSFYAPVKVFPIIAMMLDLIHRDE